jgi:hypothetical protein
MDYFELPESAHRRLDHSTPRFGKTQSPEEPLSVHQRRLHGKAMDSARISPSGRRRLQGLTSRSGMPCLPAATGKRPQLPLSAAELFALLGFFAVPSILLLYLMHAHAAFFFRYGIVANFAIAILIPIFLAWLTRGNRTVAWITALALFVWSILPAHILIPAIHPARLSLSIRKPGACEACVLANRIAPFVDASGLTFLEMEQSRRYPIPFACVLSHRSVRIHELCACQHLRRNAGGKRRVSNPRQSGAVSIFVRQHPTFLVFGTYDYPEDWLLRKLSGARNALYMLFAGVFDFSRAFAPSRCFSRTGNACSAYDFRAGFCASAASFL